MDCNTKPTDFEEVVVEDLEDNHGTFCHDYEYFFKNLFHERAKHKNCQTF